MTIATIIWIIPEDSVIVTMIVMIMMITNTSIFVDHGVIPVHVVERVIRVLLVHPVLEVHMVIKDVLVIKVHRVNQVQWVLKDVLVTMVRQVLQVDQVLLAQKVPKVLQVKVILVCPDLWVNKAHRDRWDQQVKVTLVILDHQAPKDPTVLLEKVILVCLAHRVPKDQQVKVIQDLLVQLVRSVRMVPLVLRDLRE